MTYAPTEPTAKPTPQADHGADVNSPEVNEQGQPTRKAVDNYKQAAGISKNLWEKGQEERVPKAAMVRKKYDGDSPYNQAKLNANQEGWRNNFSRGFMPSIVDRVMPQFLDPLTRADRLTFASLPELFDGAAQKSRNFQDEITQTIRNWDGYYDFIGSIAQENCLFGCAAATRLSDDWRLFVPRYDEIYLPDDAAQHASQVPMFVVVQKMMLCDFVDKLRDTQAAMDAGFDLEGCRKAANACAGIDGERTDLEEQDEIRSMGTMGFSYTKAKVVTIFHLFVREYTGEVAVWSTSKEGQHPIRHQPDFADKMGNAGCFFTLQKGNRQYYGSKGLGRSLYNIHQAIERLTCFAADQMYLSGMLVIKVPGTDINTFAPTVRHPYILIDSTCEVSEEQYQFDATNFEVMEKKLIAIAESISGAFIPPNLDEGGSPNTKIEAAQKAEREIAIKQGVLGRFFSQFAELIGMMQRLICSPTNIAEAVRLREERELKKKKGVRLVAARAYKLLQKAGSLIAKMFQGQVVEGEPETKIADQEAVDCIIRMLDKGLSPEEIAILALEPASSNVRDQNAQQDMQVAQFLEGQAQNPFIDQQAATGLKTELMIGKDRADQVLLKEPDPNVAAIATRTQVSEFHNLMDGDQVIAQAVASIDRHDVHKKVLAEMMKPYLDTIATQPPEALQGLMLCCDHYDMHVMVDPQLDEAGKQQELQVTAQIRQTVQAAGEMLAERAAMTGTQPGEMPPALNAPNMPQDPAAQAQAQNQDVSTAANIVHQTRQADREDRKLDLEERKLGLAEKQQDHSMTMDALRQSQDSAKLVGDEAARERDMALREAEIERAATSKTV